MWLYGDGHTYAPRIAKHNQNTAWRQFRAREKFLAQASRKAMHTCIRTYTYMYTYVYTYVYTYAFEVKNRIPCMSLLTTRLLCAAQFWLRPVPAKLCIYFAPESRKLRASSAQGNLSLTARELLHLTTPASNQCSCNINNMTL